MDKQQLEDACMHVFSINKTRRGLSAREIETCIVDTVRADVLPCTRQRAVRLRHCLESLVRRGCLLERRGLYSTAANPKTTPKRKKERRPSLLPRIQQREFDTTLLGSNLGSHQKRPPLALHTSWTRTEWLKAIVPLEDVERILSSIPESIRARYMDVEEIHVICEEMQTLTGIGHLTWLQQFHRIGYSLCKILYDSYHPDRFPFPQQRPALGCVNPFSDILLLGPIAHRHYWYEHSRYFVCQVLPGRLYVGPSPVAVKNEDVSYDVASCIRAAIRSYGVTDQVSFLAKHTGEAKVPGLEYHSVVFTDVYFYNMTEEKRQMIISAVDVIDKSMQDGKTVYVHSGDGVHRPCVAILAYLIGIGNPSTNPQPMRFVDAYRLLLKERGGCFGYGMKVGQALFALYEMMSSSNQGIDLPSTDLPSTEWMKMILTTSSSSLSYKTMLFECVEQMRLSADEEFRQWLGEFGSPEYRFFINVILEAFRMSDTCRKFLGRSEEDWKAVFRRAASASASASTETHTPLLLSDANLLLLNELSTRWF